MIILQTPWTPSDLQAADAALTQARRTLVDESPILALLPHADGAESEARPEDEVTGALCDLAKRQNLYLGGSAHVTAPGEKSPCTIGYLAGPDGKILLRAPKIMPDMTEGYTDTQAQSFALAELPVVRTPVGQIGILCGEDILAPHVARVIMAHGAEIILNPSRERTDNLRDIRALARVARAYENICCVALASASSITVNGLTAEQSAASGTYLYAGKPTTVSGSEAYLKVDVDLEALRRRRMSPMLNFAAIVRMNLYAPGYAKEAGKARPSPSRRADWIAEARMRVAAQAKPPRPDAINAYGAVLCQHVVYQANKPEHLIPLRQKNLDDAFQLVRSYIGRLHQAKLVVFPEFFLSGPVSPIGNRLGHLAEKIGVTFPGPEMDQVARFAQDHKAYVAGGVFEYDPEWPQRFFNTAFIYDDAGNLILRYRKIHCGDSMGFLPDTTPGSIYDQYVQKYGYEELFPVADTPIGCLTAAVCFDNNFPETYRALAKRGAEVIIHPTSEPHGGHRSGWDAARRLRAFENTAYVLSCGHGGEYFLPDRTAPSARARGYSKIINFDGSVQAEADTAGQAPLGGVIDLRALRRARADIQANLMIWDDPVVYGAEYAKAPRGLPNNLWPDDPLGNPYADGAQIKKVVDGYVREGVFVAPAMSQPTPPKRAAE